MELDLMCVSDAAAYQLGWFEGSEYVMAYNAEDVLEDLLSTASKEGGCWKMDRAKFLERDFIPFMTRVEDEPKVFAQCSKLLLLLTQPLECFAGGLSSSANAVTHTKAMLKSAKHAIHDHPEVVQTLFREMNVILDHCGSFAPSTEDIETINNCLLVFRNIFHINDEESKKHLYEATTFAAILREGLPDLYKRLISISGGRHWTVSIVQLLSLMFKDATSVSLLLELTIKGGGEDAPAKCVDYGDNFQANSVEDEEESESEEGDRDMSLTGLYMDDNESTGSGIPENYDQVQVEDKVLWRLNSGEDLNHALATFGITIMQNGFKDLVGNLLSYLTDNSSLYLDESYLTWLLSYFLKFVFLPKMNYGLVEEAVSLDIVNFLTYQTVKSVEELACEQIAINSQDGEGVYSPSLRKVHLCVMALREVFHSLNYISKCMKLSKEDQARVEENIFKISNLQDLKQLFILLLRTCPLAPSFKIYLRDIITTNHVYLLMVEHVLSSTSPQVEEFRTKFSMLDHVRFFADKSVVRAYGYMLENYELNSPCLNDCIMTMLHHISGDCNQSEALLQIPILNTFMEIYETEFPLGKESKELIEYILCKFEANCRGEEKVTQQMTKTQALDDRDSGMGTSGDEKSGQESDNNESLNCGSSYSPDNMDLGSSSDTNSDSSEPIKAKNSDTGDDDSGVGTSEGHYPFLNQLLINVSSSHVGTLRRVSPTCREGLDWVSECLFESCFAKLQMKKNADVGHLEEPISYYFNHLGVSIPIVPFSVAQSKILQDNLFITLLKQLGFHFHEGKLAIFPRIPSMWGPEKLYRMGLFLSSRSPKKFSAADVDSTERSLEKRLLGF